jgi:hypothetical protein
MGHPLQSNFKELQACVRRRGCGMVIGTVQISVPRGARKGKAVRWVGGCALVRTPAKSGAALACRLETRPKGGYHSGCGRYYWIMVVVRHRSGSIVL